MYIATIFFFCQGISPPSSLNCHHLPLTKIIKLLERRPVRRTGLMSQNNLINNITKYVEMEFKKSA